MLERWFPRSAFPELPKAKVLDIILYSREQVIKENEAMGETCDMSTCCPDARACSTVMKTNMKMEHCPLPIAKCVIIFAAEDWAIVSIKAQELEQESPMAPITMLRNALGASGRRGSCQCCHMTYRAGKEYGGSGVPLEEEKYRASVAHWRKYAVVK